MMPVLWLVFEAGFREVVCQPLVAYIVAASVVLGAVLLLGVAFSGDDQ